MQENHKRAAIYMRVSTVHQNAGIQAEDCAEVVKGRSWKPTGFYMDTACGSKEKRPELDRLLANAHKGQFDIIVVWRLDRLARNVRHLLNVLNELQELGIQVVSVKESIDASSVMGKAMITMLGVFAEVERELIRERITAGVRARMAKGLPQGRPARIFDKELALELRKKGHTLEEVARIISKNMKKPISLRTLNRFLSEKGVKRG